VVTPTVTYLFDPLCGWCYGASPTLTQLARERGFTLRMVPSGLFAQGNRSMDAAFAAHAWANDQRIAHLTGQRFSEDYRQQVLGALGRAFDSSATTLALSAVQQVVPSRELDILVRLQEARYVQGQDTSDMAVVAQLLRGQGLGLVADRLLNPSSALKAFNAQRMAQALGLMRHLGVDGVPALVVADERGERRVNSQLLYGPVKPLLDAIRRG
jgi:putative protein-disulfide isomerase